jgi:clathrin heavy chain
VNINSVSHITFSTIAAGQTLQVFDIGAKAKIKGYQMPTNDSVVFWRWITPTLIAIVTPTAVFHWTTDDGMLNHRILSRLARFSHLPTLPLQTKLTPSRFSIVFLT